MCRAFSLFLLVYEKTSPKVGQWKNFVLASGIFMSRKKCFEFRKSPTHFYALKSGEHFGKISLKSADLHTVLIHLKMRNSRKNKAVFSALKHFQSFPTLLKFSSTRSCRRPIKHKEAFPGEFYYKTII